MALQLVTAASVLPLTLAEAKAHLRVDHSDEDALITMCIQAATTYADGKDGFLGRALVTQTWDLILDAFPDSELMIPLPPLQEVVSVEYDDGAGEVQLLDVADYTVDTASEPGWISSVGGSWPTTFAGINAVRVRFIAGYPPSTDSPPDLRANVPASIKYGMLLTIGHLYANRETVVVGTSAMQMPWGIVELLKPYRVQLGMQ